MKALLLLFILALPVLAEELTPTSEIKTVTVFQDRARITRSASVKLNPGENSIKLSNLPIGLDTQSIRVHAKADTKLQILGIDIQDQFQTELANKTAEELTQTLQELKDNKQSLTLQLQDISEQKAFLQRTRDGLTAQRAKEDTGLITPEGIKALYAFYSDELRRLTGVAFSTTLQVRDAEPKIQALELQISQLRGSNKATKSALIAVKVEKPTNADIFVDYNIGNASWSPIYDARVDTDKEILQLDYKAKITQQTGENWDNVRMALSTAKPSIAGRMPELQPWLISFFRPMPLSAPMASGMASGRASFKAISQVNEATIMDERQEATTPEAIVKNNGITAVFEIAQPVSIPCDGTSHIVSITSKEVKGKFGYTTTPKLSEIAYLKAALTNTTGAPILGGTVNIFRDGDFIGASQLNFVAQDANFDLYLGPDENIKVTYKALADVSNESWFRGKKELNKKFETTIENFKPKPIDISILDQQPIVQDKDIAISDIVNMPNPTTVDKDTGAETWVLTLQPKDKKSITKSFKVSWPADKNIQGL